MRPAAALELRLDHTVLGAHGLDDLTAADMVAVYNEKNETKLVILGEAMTTEPYAFAFAFGSEDLVAEINKIQAELLADGTIKAIFEKYNAPYTAPDSAK